MRKLAYAVAVLMLMVVPAENGSVASAAEGFYLGVQGGINDMEDTESEGATGEMDSGYTIAAVVGYDFGYFRLEGEVAHRENDIGAITLLGNDTVSSGDVTSTAFMLNGYLDMENRTPFTPYLGAGIGYNFVEDNGTAVYGGSTTVRYDDSDSVAAYQLTAGIAWDVTKTFVLDLSYKYLYSDDIEVAGTSNWGVTNTGKIDYESQNFMIGLRWYF
ncbi:outer membrane beta-barrel protein [uncultured Desulfosarcina sp.]|uniref:outer membrane protein n=1 Tax=uncultured Desulfosarcina sp. TaxID=218289 RepID=UPI0029C9330D|nr:outer membrane beta-barrel protein [uncultured Desulfosarcina sp.]